MTERVSTFCYVPLSRIPDFEALGWRFSHDLGPPHALYAQGFEWPHDTDPIFPPEKRDEKREDGDGHEKHT